jgi:hypothetical protein
MAIFEIRDGKFAPVAETSFGAEGIYERRDIQRLLKESIDVLGERLLVIAEEFGEWVDSSRRIDLLCLDTDANLVVIELKRTEDGGFMELQAIRYAAMISEMTFDQLIEAHARFRNRLQPDFESARSDILQFLSWDEASEDQFGNDVRIVLAAADFGKELTTSAMWLRERGIDVRCVRLKPYRLEGGPLLLDVQQLIPLPEASNFQTQIGVKRQAQRQGRTTERHELRYRFWEGLLGYAKTLTQIHANRSPTKDNWISGGIGRSGFSLSYVVRQFDCQVELWISLGAGHAAENKAAFHALDSQKAAIQAEFGSELDWQELSSGDGCRIRYLLDGGYKSPSEQWPELYERLVSAMLKLDSVMRPRVHTLKLTGA